MTKYEIGGKWRGKSKATGQMIYGTLSFTQGEHRMNCSIVSDGEERPIRHPAKRIGIDSRGEEVYLDDYLELEPSDGLSYRYSMPAFLCSDARISSGRLCR